MRSAKRTKALNYVRHGADEFFEGAPARVDSPHRKGVFEGLELELLDLQQQKNQKTQVGKYSFIYKYCPR